MLMALDTAPGILALVTAVHTVLATAPDVGATLDTAPGMAMLMALDTAPGILALVTAVHTVLATAPDVGATLDTALGMAMLMALDTAPGMAVGTTAILSFSLHSEGNCSSALSRLDVSAALPTGNGPDLNLQT